MGNTFQVTIDAAGPRALGGSIVGEFDGPKGHWIVMLDPEDNEFCIQ